MRLNEPLLAELHIEAATTRKVFERLPEGSFDWRPHPRSRTLGELASHVAEIPGLFLATLAAEGHDRSGPSHVASTVAELLDRFDDHVARSTKVLAGLEDAQLLSPWRYTVGGRTLFELPRFVVARSTALDHWIHHRGQLTVYLRLLDVPVPPIYGPTADAAGP